MSNRSQTQAIAAHFRAGRSITALAALRLYGCFRLAARVYELRQAGWAIQARAKVIGGKRVAEYCIPG